MKWPQTAGPSSAKPARVSVRSVNTPPLLVNRPIARRLRAGGALAGGCRTIVGTPTARRRRCLRTPGRGGHRRSTSTRRDCPLHTRPAPDHSDNPRHLLPRAAEHARCGRGGDGRGPFVVHCCRIAAKAPDAGGFLTSTRKSAVLQLILGLVGAVGLEPTLPKDPDFKSGKMCCTGLNGLANPAYTEGFLSTSCTLLHRIALPVVSGWRQALG
jgi:hypothetical protein